MGEHRLANGGRPVIDLRHKVALVDNVLIEDIADDQVVILMLGDPKPKLGIAMTPDQARHLADKLIEHADAVSAATNLAAQDDDAEDHHR